MATENDVVLIYFEEKPAGFARIEEILPDSKRDWYHVKLLLLQLPLQTVTWILRDVYINGETFTMNGNRMRLEKVECPASELPEDTPLDESDEEDTDSDAPDKEAKVISLADLKKK